MIHTDGVPTIAMRESEPLDALEANRDLGDETAVDDTPDHFEGNLGANIAGGRL